MTEQMTVRGTLKGHTGWVTQIATTPQFPDMILSASRGEHFHRSLAPNANVSVLALTGGLSVAFTEPILCSPGKRQNCVSSVHL